MLVRLASTAALVCLLAVPATAATAPFAATITRETVTGHQAAFRFRAVDGGTTGFFCSLSARTGKAIPEATLCNSPTHYTRLRKNTYTFSVYAAGPKGISLTATRVFTIR